MSPTMFNARTGRPRLARRVAARGPDACGGTKMSEKNGKAAVTVEGKTDASDKKQNKKPQTYVNPKKKKKTNG